MDTYQQIDLCEYHQTGEGGTAVTYTHNNGRCLAKLYKPAFLIVNAKSEFLTARTVFELGIPTPEPIRLVTDGERYGAEYEFIEGKRSFARIISQEPERLHEISVSFARMTKELHTTVADTMRLASVKEKVRRFYIEKDMVPADFKQKALRFLEQVPEGKTCIHGDLQVGNLITDGKRTLWIDIGEFGYGVPEWDLGPLWLMAASLNDDISDYLFHITAETFAASTKIFFSTYLGTTDPQRILETIKHVMPYGVVKVPYMFSIAESRSMPDHFFEKFTNVLD